MIKSMMNMFLMMYPIIVNIFMIMLMMNPSKKYKIHPLSFMMILILLTILICLKMNFIFKSWVPFILFLTMIGGLMIIFMYIISLINNEKFYMNIKLIMINSLKISFFMILILIFTLMFYNFIYLDMNSQFSWIKNYMNMWDQYNMNLIYKQFFLKSTIFIMIYLYYSMICIMNICFLSKMPLRKISF